MQYTSKIALLAVALFGTSVLAAPFADEAGYEVEAREVEDDLAAREFFEMYLEARADPSLDARDIESLDFEAREYFDYLEAREAASLAATQPPQTPPQSPLSPSPRPQSTRVETTEKKTTEKSNAPTPNDATRSESKPKVNTSNLSPHQQSVRRAKKLAVKEFEDPKVYKNALADKENKFHHYAVLKYLSKPEHLKEAIATKDSPYHKVAKRVVHQRKAKVYLSDKKNFNRALKRKHHKYHKDAVKKYLAHGDNFDKSLADKKSRFHKAAVHEYLLDKKTRKSVLADSTSPYYKQAKKLQKKIDQRRAKLSGGSLSGNSTTSSA